MRDFIKLATLICFNVPSRSKAIGAIWKELHKWREQKRATLLDLPEPAELVRRIAIVHDRIAGDLFANRGMRLISIEGGILLQTMREFVLEAKKPALPIHDALVVRKGDASFAKQVMERVYRDVTGFKPVIKIKTF